MAGKVGLEPTYDTLTVCSPTGLVHFPKNVAVNNGYETALRDAGCLDAPRAPGTALRPCRETWTKVLPLIPSDHYLQPS